MNTELENEIIVENIMHSLLNANEASFDKEYIPGRANYNLNLMQSLDNCNVKVIMKGSQLNTDRQPQIKIFNKRNEECLTIQALPKGSFPAYIYSVRNKRIDAMSTRKMLSLFSINKIQEIIQEKLEKPITNIKDEIEPSKQILMNEVFNYFAENQLLKNQLSLSNRNTQESLEALFKYIGVVDKETFNEDHEGKLSITKNMQSIGLQINTGQQWSTFKKTNIILSDKNGNELITLFKHPDTESNNYDCYIKGKYVKHEHAQTLLEILPIKEIAMQMIVFLQEKRTDNIALDVSKKEPQNNINSVTQRILEMQSHQSKAKILRTFKKTY